ncbi:hypothetical protein B0O80DRAFT_224967 [Mortierella sp. GBAus27b]|nr:hypothetical protein B0O80DRAFT_224967 [Mortierella sp. GBAus27b]
MSKVPELPDKLSIAVNSILSQNAIQVERGWANVQVNNMVVVAPAKGIRERGSQGTDLSRRQGLGSRVRFKSARERAHDRHIAVFGKGRQRVQGVEIGNVTVRLEMLEHTGLTLPVGFGLHPLDGAASIRSLDFLSVGMGSIINVDLTRRENLELGEDDSVDGCARDGSRGVSTLVTHDAQLQGDLGLVGSLLSGGQLLFTLALGSLGHVLACDHGSSGSDNDGSSKGLEASILGALNRGANLLAVGSIVGDMEVAGDISILLSNNADVARRGRALVDNTARDHAGGGGHVSSNDAANNLAGLSSLSLFLSDIAKVSLGFPDRNVHELAILVTLKLGADSVAVVLINDDIADDLTNGRAFSDNAGSHENLGDGRAGAGDDISDNVTDSVALGALGK